MESENGDISLLQKAHSEIGLRQLADITDGLKGRKVGRPELGDLWFGGNKES